MEDRNEINRDVIAGVVSALTSAAKRIKQAGTEEEKNNESQSTFSSSACEKAIQNAEVLQNIFKFLSYKDLQACRYVGLPQWSTEAEHLMSQRPLLCIEWLGSEVTMVKTFQRRKVLSKFQSISELITKLETYERDHEIWLKIQYENIALDDLKIFLKKFTKVICHLDLDLVVPPNTISPTDLQNLLNELPNLTHLTLTLFPRSGQEVDETWNLTMMLSQIQTVSFRYRNFPTGQSCLTLLKRLFRIMPNLKNVYGFPLHCIDLLTADDQQLNLGSIKSVDFRKTGTQLQAELSKLADISQRIGLQGAHLIFDSSLTQKAVWKSCCESLSTILRNNQNTLEYLTIVPFCVPQFLEYPELTAVKKLCLFTSMSQKIYQKNGAKKFFFFGKNFNVRNSFPNLVEVNVEGGNFSTNDFLELLPDDAFTQSYFPGVTSLHLKFKYFVNPEALEKIVKMFPDITNLFMDIEKYKVERMLPLILRWWPKLTSLKLKVNVRDESYRPITDKYLLDPVFTGISAAKCTELRKSQEKLDIDLKSYREKAGISALSELKKLILIFQWESSRGQAKTQEAIPLISHVTSFYGFQSLPDLKVTCAIPWDDKESDKIREMLNPIEEHVILHPNYYEEPAYYQDFI